MENQPTTSKTVKLNVGGRHFEVSRDLIEQQPDSMLAKLISKTWQASPDKTIFIERDGDTFGYVLNYLRDGNVVLPPIISTGTFTRDLDYYGLEYGQETIIDGNEVIAGLTEENKALKEKMREMTMDAEVGRKFSEEMDRLVHDYPDIFDSLVAQTHH